MDFLDPIKERRTRFRLFVGYALVALAIGIASLILLYWSYGYSVTSDGDVAQKGLVFVSSQPSGANVSLDGIDSKTQTGAKLNLKSGSYLMTLSLAGYTSWSHPITVRGGDVQHFDYPQLFPKTLQTSVLRTFDAAPSLISQSPDHRWILWMGSSKPGDFFVYDLKDPTKPASSEIALPAGLFTESIGAQSWSVIEWASDNRHVLLKHDYTTATATASEYLLFDRSKPDQSQNLTKDLSLVPTDVLTLFNQKPDRFYAYSTETKVLRSFTATNPLDTQIAAVRAYKTYGSDTVLYVTDVPPGGKQTAGEVSVVLKQGNRTTVLRQLPDSTAPYLLDIAEYDSSWYVVVGSAAESGVYIYKDPQTNTSGDVTALPLAWRYLRVDHPSYVAFSANARFILAENGQHLAVYDAENIQTFVYSLARPIDQPQAHVTWKDGHRMSYVSEGKLVVTEFDNYNTRVLQPASPLYAPMYSGDENYGFVADAPNGSWQLTTTPYVVK